MLMPVSRPSSQAQAQAQAQAQVESVTLDALVLGQTARVLAVQPPGHAPDWARLLEELGFLAGEPVTLLARASLGGDPLVARIGASTFALRRAEAACVRVALAREPQA